jgi:curved DNA-binding protein CbpA
MFKDYYAMLGVARGAAETEIRSAYRRLAAAHHPDKVSTESPEKQDRAAAMLLELNEAIAVLRDPQRKAKYDHDLSFIPSRGYAPEPDLPSSTAEASVSQPRPAANSSPSPVQLVDREIRAQHLRMRLETLPLQFTDLKWPGWIWSLKAENGSPLVLAHRHTDTLTPAFVQALEKSLAAAMERESGFRRAGIIVLLTCGRVVDHRRALQDLEQIATKDRGWFAKKPMLILYDEAGKRGVRIGQAPEHDRLPQILKILMAP